MIRIDCRNATGLRWKFQCNPDGYGWLVVQKKTLAYLFSLINRHHVYRIYRVRLDAEQPRKGCAAALAQNALSYVPAKPTDFRRCRNNFRRLRRIAWRERHLRGDLSDTSFELKRPCRPVK